jgi:Mg-chelatase subunit ChlD
MNALAALAWLVAPAAVTAVTPARPAPVAKAAPRVEVAFVLDTTGSMGGLIEGAKRRIWSIARRIGEGRPRPDLRIALVAYRDLGDAYVTRVFDLTGDMDQVYQNLTSFQAQGGGDTPEHVSAALSDAVSKVSWSRQAGMQVIFLVGDAPPHVDYQDGYDYRRHVREARERGIAVETVQCGGDSETARVWTRIASLGGGHYARIDGQGGMPVMVTPVDAELARLNAELTSTVVAGGSREEQKRASLRLDARAAMPAAMAVEAAPYFAAAERLAETDLVGMAPAAQKNELEKLRARPEDLPKPLQSKSDKEALAYLDAQKQKRQQLQGRIAELQKERDAYAAKAQPAKDGFDEQVVQSLRERAAKAGIEY